MRCRPPRRQSACLPSRWEVGAVGRVRRSFSPIEVATISPARMTRTWVLDLTLGDGTDHDWIYRRDPSVQIQWDVAVLRTADGIPYLAPDLQLLFKSKGLRPKDDSPVRGSTAHRRSRPLPGGPDRAVRRLRICACGAAARSRSRHLCAGACAGSVGAAWQAESSSSSGPPASPSRPEPPRVWWGLWRVSAHLPIRVAAMGRSRRPNPRPERRESDVQNPPGGRRTRTRNRRSVLAGSAGARPQNRCCVRRRDAPADVP